MPLDKRTQPVLLLDASLCNEFFESMLLNNGQNSGLIGHLFELRKRLLCVFVVYGVIFLGFFFVAPGLFQTLISPLLNLLPNNSNIIATSVTASIFIPIRIAADAALIVVMPFVLLQLWCFISPGLYPHERNVMAWIMGGSVFLFVVGVFCCFYIILPILLQFFVQAVPTHVLLMPDIADVVDFITRMLLLFGFCFQVPLVCWALVRSQVVDVHTLIAARPYVIVAAFIIGMLLTPPDVLSQLMFAIPFCMLYELGLLLARHLRGSKILR